MPLRICASWTEWWVFSQTSFVLKTGTDYMFASISIFSKIEFRRSVVEQNNDSDIKNSGFIEKLGYIGLSQSVNCIRPSFRPPKATSFFTEINTDISRYLSWQEPNEGRRKLSRSLVKYKWCHGSICSVCSRWLKTLPNQCNICCYTRTGCFSNETMIVLWKQ